MDHAQEQAQESPPESNPLDPQEQASTQKSAQDSSGAQTQQDPVPESDQAQAQEIQPPKTP